MQRIKAVLKKLEEISEQKDISDIDIDLMLDYTRVMYADLSELKKKNDFNTMLQTNEKARPNVDTSESAERNNITEEREEIHIAQQPKEDEAPTTDVITEPNYTGEPTFVDVEENPPVPVYATNKDIRTYIGINDKYLFITELFNDDKAAYDEAIKNINQCSNEEEADKWINVNLHKTYNWSIDNETTQSFYDLINSFFSDK